ncbi:cholecystokinin A receptor [Mytilus galloprovincialis]|uniref:Cholecystokinin A receptor n=1 Tax=Mytilus galloprovincialis TaxID=29158 RepID=A0A8B6H5V1_MYTGA|nr:cholecystokinin A receptor [Mytilus galloprovincialis]
MKNLTVWEWNDEIIVSLTPNIVVLCVYLFVGIFGNVLVLLVYGCQMKNTSDERCFIPILAACDLIATLCLGSFAIYNSINQVTYSNYVVCKITTFFNGLATFLPTCVLLIIAIQRYVKICTTINHSTTLFFKRVSIVLANLCSVLVTLPLSFVAKLIPIHSSRYQITGIRCGTSSKGNNLARNIYFIVVGFFVVFTVTAFIVLYARIAYTIFGHLKKRRHQNNKKGKEANIEENSVENNKETEEDLTIGDFQRNSHKRKCNGKIHTATISKTESVRRKRNRAMTHKMAIMFFVITLVFCISYLPKIIVIIMSGIYKDFVEKLSNPERSAVLFVYDMQIINNIVNPFIYAFMDTKFRTEATTFLKRLFH